MVPCCGHCNKSGGPRGHSQSFSRSVPSPGARYQTHWACTQLHWMGSQTDAPQNAFSRRSSSTILEVVAIESARWAPIEAHFHVPKCVLPMELFSRVTIRPRRSTPTKASTACCPANWARAAALSAFSTLRRRTPSTAKVRKAFAN